MPIVGILGGIGSGKSSVIRQVHDLRLQILDADRMGHELLADSRIAEQVRDRFGAAVVDHNGKMIRGELAKRVFGTTPEQQAGKRDLEKILHPRIRQEIEASIHATLHDVDVIILDAALLLEVGWVCVCDQLIFVDAPQTVREERVIRDRGWTVDELRRREATQMSVERKRAAADFVVDNSGLIETAADEMSRVLHQIVNQHGPDHSRPDSHAGGQPPGQHLQFPSS